MIRKLEEFIGFVIEFNSKASFLQYSVRFYSDVNFAVATRAARGRE
jgi:hypothetical protein